MLATRKIKVPYTFHTLTRKLSRNFSDEAYNKFPQPVLKYRFSKVISEDKTPVSLTSLLSNEEPPANTNISIPKSFSQLKGFQAIVGKVPDQVLDLADMLKNFKKYERMGAQRPRGLLMVGPPGTGKSRLAKALIEESNGFYIYTHASEFLNRYIGQTEKNIRETFLKLRKSDPNKLAMLFIDEIDAIGSRANTDQNPNLDGARAELLVQMDGLSYAGSSVINGNNHNIVVLGATNNADAIDPALKRPGRFDQIVEVPLPDYESRIELLKFYLSFIRYNTEDINDAYIKEIAIILENFSPADIKYIVNEAAIIAVKDDVDSTNKNHLMRSIERFHMRKSNVNQSIRSAYITQAMFKPSQSADQDTSPSRSSTNSCQFHK